MHELSELGPAIDRCEPFSEARAHLDFTCMGERTVEWIVSHERIRRVLSATEKRRDALQEQIESLNKQVATLQLEVRSQAGWKSQCENLKRRCQELQTKVQSLTAELGIANGKVNQPA